MSTFSASQAGFVLLLRAKTVLSGPPSSARFSLGAQQAFVTLHDPPASCSWPQRKLGPTGRAIDIDMTPEMIERTRANAQARGYTNVEFYQATIDMFPPPDGSVVGQLNRFIIPSG